MKFAACKKGTILMDIRFRDNNWIGYCNVSRFFVVLKDKHDYVTAIWAQDGISHIQPQLRTVAFNLAGEFRGRRLDANFVEGACTESSELEMAVYGVKLPRRYRQADML